MLNYLINFWIISNCKGNPIGSVVVNNNLCVEPSFGLGFRANDTYITISNNCTDTKNINSVFCEVNSGCCYIPEGLSVNITTSSLPISKNEKRHAFFKSTNMTPLPPPSPGRVFVCTEQDIIT